MKTFISILLFDCNMSHTYRANLNSVIFQNMLGGFVKLY